MSTETADWQKIKEYLEPKRSNYWIEEPSLTQKVFLKSETTEVLFGGEKREMNGNCSFAIC